MSWYDETLDKLAANPAIGYAAGASVAAEPTALATLALAANGRGDAAQRGAEVLASMQAADGAVGVRPGEMPGWPTSLAIVAWSVAGRMLNEAGRFKGNSGRAADWLLAHRGKAIERSGDFGHNSELVGWAYAENTHSWIEPTAMAVLALATTGQLEHPAAQEGIAVLLDRQLPGGGYNYGNTYVLGQLIRPHIQPTGITLLALSVAGQQPAVVAKSIAWLQRSIGQDTTPISLAWALLGLQSQGEDVREASDWLAAAAERVQLRDRSPHKRALLALAAQGWPS